MKSFVVGAMLLHCMNAQLAPVIAPGINAPSESDLVLGSPDVVTPSSNLPDVPTGTADVVLDEATPVASFGGGSAPGTGISFGPEGVRILEADPFQANTFVFPSQPPPLTDATPVAQPAASSDTPADAVILADTTNPVVIAEPTPVDGGSAVVGTPVAIVASSVDTAPTPIVNPSDVVAPVNSAPVATPVDAVPVASPVNAAPIVAPSDTVPVVAPVDAVPVASPVDPVPVVAPSETAPVIAPVDAVPVVEPTLSVAPSESSVLPSGASSTGLVDADPLSATSSIVLTPTLFPGGSAALPIGSNPYYGPYPPDSPYDPSSPYYDPTAQPPGWEGDDNGIYDGEDDDAYPGYHDHDEKCPAWCLPEDDSYPTSTPDYDYSPYQPTPTPEYLGYETTAEPYPEYETTPTYTPYPKTYPTPSYAAEPYQQEPYPTSTSDYEAAPQYYPAPEPQYYPEPDQSYPQFKKVRSILRAVRRQVFNWPQSAAYPQPQYSDDDDSGEYDGEDGSIPDWLYDISGAPAKPTYSPKPKKCPKSCYKPKTSAAGYATKHEKPTYTYTRKGGYKTTESPYQTTEEPYYPEPTTDGYYGDETTDAPYPGYTSSVWYPAGNSSSMYWPTGPTNIPDEPTSIPSEPTSIPDEPTSVPYEATVAPYEPTTLATYYQPAQSYPEQTGGGWSDPGSPAGDYTGETLDTICPSTCNPFNPAENFCDITTGCATTGGSKYYCACRAGFRADGYNAKDFSKQFKVAGQPYVYLAVSTSCNTPCSDQTCSEVLERSQCK
ncbi:hypothetical protein E8E12_003562 [Didymella heteroderae]|uniref:EGF-like domain-containing protein n=1 Tax=Didymella heteroderae TaxID=1769908 RepID=A0A9P4WYP1_9PLEO|nr:hypothetical protein E8E12_003562 [Didymella heteroderae]